MKVGKIVTKNIKKNKMPYFKVDLNDNFIQSSNLVIKGTSQTKNTIQDIIKEYYLLQDRLHHHITPFRVGVSAEWMSRTCIYISRNTKILSVVQGFLGNSKNILRILVSRLVTKKSISILQTNLYSFKKTLTELENCTKEIDEFLLTYCNKLNELSLTTRKTLLVNKTLANKAILKFKHNINCSTIDESCIYEAYNSELFKYSEKELSKELSVTASVLVKDINETRSLIKSMQFLVTTLSDVCNKINEAKEYDFKEYDIAFSGLKTNINHLSMINNQSALPINLVFLIILEVLTQLIKQSEFFLLISKRLDEESIKAANTVKICTKDFL